MADIFTDILDAALAATVDTSKDIAIFSKVGGFISGTKANFDVLIKDGITGVVKQHIAGIVDQATLASDPSLTHTVETIPTNFAGLEAVDIPTRLREQYFEIYDVSEEDEEVVITARHVWYQNLQNNTLWKPEDDTSYSGQEVAKHILGDAMFPTKFEVETDCTDTLPAFSLLNPEHPR